MDREGFRNRLKQYKLAREENPGLKYWEWKQKYDAAPQPDSMPGQPQPDQPTPVSQPLSNMSHRTDNPHTVLGREPFDSPYDDARYFDYRKPRFELRKGDVHYANPNVLKWMGRFGKILRGGSLLGEAVQNLFPSEEAELIEDLRIKMDKQNKWLTGLEDIPKYDEGGRVIPTQEEYITQQIDAKKAAALAAFRNATEPVLPIINGLPNVNSCIYTALNMYGKKYATPGNWTFYDDPGKHGFKQKELSKALPSDLIQVFDKNKPYHMMMLDGYDEQGHPLYNYSRGMKGDSSDIVKAETNFPNTKKLAYEFVGTPADSTQWINDYKKIYGFAEGTDGVTGPPTYEQWYDDMIQYNPTILDDASLYWSLEAAKKDLHKQAMGLPGYAPMWHEYVRSLPKADPDINQFVDDLWANENRNNVGYRNGKYYPHKSPEGGKMTIGPGFKLDSGSHGISTKTANRGMTKTRLDQEARKIGKQHLKAVDQFINYGQTTNPADTVSPQIKMGLMDLRHLVGPLNEWGNLRQAVLEGDLDRIRKESTVTWNDNGKTKVDKRRKKIRDEKYFYYE